MASPTALICWDSADVFASGVQLQTPGGDVHAEDNDQFLIGRAFIRKHRLLFDGPANRVCVIPAAATIA